MLTKKGRPIYPIDHHSSSTFSQPVFGEKRSRFLRVTTNGIPLMLVVCLDQKWCGQWIVYVFPAVHPRWPLHRVTMSTFSINREFICSAVTCDNGSVAHSVTISSNITRIFTLTQLSGYKHLYNIAVFPRRNTLNITKTKDWQKIHCTCNLDM